MGKLAAAVDTLLTCLWDEEVALEAASLKQPFIELLTQAKDSIAARKFAADKKPLRGDLQPGDIRSAKKFLTRLFRAEERTGETREVKEKRDCLRRLGDRPLSILAVLYSEDEILKAALGTVKALSEGAVRIAEWSKWPNDTELISAVQEQRPLSATSAGSAGTSNVASQVVQTLSSTRTATVRAETTSDSPNPASTAELTQIHPAPPGQVLLTCSSCGTGLRLRFTCERATDGASPIATTTTPATDPLGTTWTAASASLAATPATSGDRPGQPNVPANVLLSPTTKSLVVRADDTLAGAQSPYTGGNKLDSTSSGSVSVTGAAQRKRQRRETDALDGTPITAVARQAPLVSGDLSDSCAAVFRPNQPNLPQAPFSQPHDSGFQAPHPGPVGPSTIPCSSVQPGLLISARPNRLNDVSAHPAVNTENQHPVEEFSDLLHNRAIVSTHSGEVLVSMIKRLNSNIRFEHQSGWYKTDWIGGCFRIVITEKGAEKTHQLQSFERTSSELAEFFAKRSSFTTIFVKDYGGVTLVTKDCEVQWWGHAFLALLKKNSNSFMFDSLYRRFLQILQTVPVVGTCVSGPAEE